MNLLNLALILLAVFFVRDVLDKVKTTKTPFMGVFSLLDAMIPLTLRVI